MRVLHLVGSVVSTFHADLSRLYAADCLHTVSQSPRYDSVVAYLTPDRRWRFPRDLSPAAIAAAPPVPVEQALRTVVDLGVDMMVPQMFCLPGMTEYRGLFDVLGIPYPGNPPAAMALTAHKARARAVVADAGVAVPAGELLRPGDRPSLTPPVVVKPADADNSAGVTLVHRGEEYDAALVGAFAHSTEVQVERYVELGREVRCGVLERDGSLLCLPLEEYAVDPDRMPVRTTANKIVEESPGDLRLVAKDAEHAWLVDPDDPVTGPVHDAARACHRALGCRDYSLFDFRIDPDGRPWFLEAGLYCSYSRSSVLAVMAAAAGITTIELFDTAVAAALARRAAVTRA